MAPYERWLAITPARAEPSSRRCVELSASCSGGFAGFGLGEQSGFAGGEDSLGSAGGGQTTGEGDGGGGLRALEGDGEQVDQRVDGERVVVAVLVE